MDVTPPSIPPSMPGMPPLGSGDDPEAAMFGLVLQGAIIYQAPWANLASYLYNHIMAQGIGGDHVKIEEYIDSVLTSKEPEAAGQGDIYMRFNLTQESLNGTGPGNFLSAMMMMKQECPSDPWLPPSIPQYNSNDEMYFAIYNIPQQSDIQPFQQDVLSQVKLLTSESAPSPVSLGQLESAVAGLIFNPDFFNKYPGITLSTRSDLYNFLTQAGVPMPPFCQSIFENVFFRYQSWIQEQGSGASLVSSYLREVQFIWASGTTTGPTDLTNWFANQTVKNPLGPAAFFSQYQGIALSDLQNLAVVCNYPPAWEANCYFEAGQWLQNNPFDPGQNLMTHLLNEVSSLWSSGNTDPSSLSNWATEQIFDPSFFKTYSEPYAAFDNFLNFAGATVTDKDLEQAYYNFGSWGAGLPSNSPNLPLAQLFIHEIGSLWGSSPSPGNTLFQQLQAIGEGIINNAFLDTSNHPICDETGAQAMENVLNNIDPVKFPFASPDAHLQHALCQVLTFMDAKDVNSQEYQFALKFVQLAFPPDWSTGSLSGLQAYMNNWFKPPTGQDPYLMFPGVPLADMQGLFTSMGLTYSPPSAIDIKCQAAASYLQGLTAGSPDAKLFNDFIVLYQTMGSQQGVANPNYQTLLMWANNNIRLDFLNYPNVSQATKNEFYNEIATYENDPSIPIYMDRNYIEDTWVPAHIGYGQMKFANTLIGQMTTYLENPPPGTSFQQYISSVFFDNIPVTYPNMPFTDATNLISNLKSVTLYPTYNAYIAAVTDSSMFPLNTGGQALFQSLAQTIASDRNDPDLKTNIIPWMQSVIAGTTSWKDSQGTTYTWPDNLTDNQIAAFKSIGNLT